MIFNWLAISDLRDVLRQLSNLTPSNYGMLGLELGLFEPTVNRLESTHSSEDLGRHIMKAWLNQVDNVKCPTWECLIAALQSPLVQQNATAQQLRQWLTKQKATTQQHTENATETTGHSTTTETNATETTGHSTTTDTETTGHSTTTETNATGTTDATETTGHSTTTETNATETTGHSTTTETNANK